MRLHLIAAAALAVSASGALAAKPKAKQPAVPAASTTPATASTAKGAPVDNVVATVDGHPIHLSDLDAAVQELPQNMRSLPPAQLFPVLIDQLVDRQALALAARKQGVQNDPVVQRQMLRAQDQVLQNALLRRDLAPQLTETSLHALYDKEIGTKPGEEEVQASHILVPTEDKARDIIKQLKGGADFATLAKANSTDPSGKENGGDLGYFKRADMLPEFSAAAFALKPGEITQTPVKTRYGYHVIKLVNRRLASPPTFSEAENQLQQELVQKLVQQEVAKAKEGMKIERFNSDGTPAKGAPVVVAPPGAPAGAPAGTVPAAPAGAPPAPR